MTKFIFAILVLVSASAGADSCKPFTGIYHTELACQGITFHDGIKIDYTDANQQLIVKYDPVSGNFPEENYIADGVQHAGDVNNTGDTYTASCTGSKMVIRRVFRQLIAPLQEEITLTGTGLHFIETFEGRDGATVCDFVK